MSRPGRFWSRIAVFSVLATLNGQSDLATVTGAVTDAGQAVIPSASVSVRNTGTNQLHIILTNEKGYYTITDLPPGPYEIAVARDGFIERRQAGIVLETGQKLRLDFKLALGSVSASVNVTATVPALNSENGVIRGDVIVQTEIQAMPLNGRDFTELALTVPGVTTNAQGGAGSGFAINGARADNTNFYVDGFDDRNVRGGAAQLRPNIDALQEFKMETSGFSAEYGKMAGGIMNMVLRSGANQPHGALFEYFRNDVFDARAYFDSARLPLHQNQFGGAVAGPIRIPKLYNGHDRTFYMVSWESQRLVWGETKLGNVPTSGERAGDFSQLVDNLGKKIVLKNPFNGNAAFPGNLIPLSMIGPAALKLTRYYPLPDRTQFGNNFQAESFNISNWDSYIFKVDHRISGQDSLSVNFGKRFNRSNAPWAGSNLGEFPNAKRDDRELGGLVLNHLFSPSFVMEARAGLSRNAQREHIVPGGIDQASQAGIQGSTTDPLLEGMPLVNITNYLSIGYAANQPVRFFISEIQTAVKFTWIKNQHIVKWGLDIARNRFNQPYYNNNRGTLTATNSWTGDAYGDILLGLINSSSNTIGGIGNYLRSTDYGLFFNDDWKVARSLTLNLGIRYELDLPPTDLYGRMLNFLPSLGKIVIANESIIPGFTELVAGANLSNLVTTARLAGLPQSLVEPDYKGFAPRIGFAWRPGGRDRTVIRAGYGIFYSGSILNDIRVGLQDSFPFATTQTFARVSANPGALTLTNPWPAALAVQGGTTTTTGFQYNAPLPYLQSYNFTVERDLGKGVTVEAAYVGSKGTHLGRQYNVNLPFRGIAWYMASGTNFPVSYPPLGTINYWDFGSNSIYNSAQFTLRKRAAGGIFYSIDYTYAKSIDDASQLTGASTGGFAQALDPRNLGLERARSDWDRGHVVTAVFSYQLPAGTGKALLAKAGPILNGLAGNWELAGNMRFTTGPPLTVETSAINAAIGESTRPNRIANGAELTGSGRRGIDFPWFSPAAFAAVPSCASRTNCSPDPYGFPPFAPGNSGRNILDAPGVENINLSLLKSWPLEERKRVQFRWEVFNIFNHPNFLIPNRFFNETAAGILNAVADSGNGGPRIMQFALRYEF